MQTVAARIVRRHGVSGLRYAIVGLSGYLVSLALFAAQLGAGISPYAAIPAGFVVNTLWNFVLNRLWSFPGSASSWSSDFGRFAVVAFMTLAANYSLLYLLHDAAGLAPVPSQALAILLVVPIGYFGQRYWAFATG